MEETIKTHIDRKHNLYDAVLNVNIDVSGLAGLKDFEEAIKGAVKEAEKDLAAQVHAKAVELANERLHARRQMFVDALSVKEEEGAWFVELAASARWIDEGQEPWSIKDALLASPKAKTAKDGSTYVVVPFEHGPGKGATNTPASSQDIVSTVKSEMKKRKIPWAKVERDDQGRPKLGKLHGFDIMNGPAKTGQGPGQGWGPVGDVKQGPNDRQKVGGGPAGGGTPFLQGVAVYQHAMEGGGVRRSVMTFRIASSKQEDHRWRHPGLDASNIIDDAYKWALDQVETAVIPQVLDALEKRL